MAKRDRRTDAERRDWSGRRTARPDDGTCCLCGSARPPGNRYLCNACEMDSAALAAETPRSDAWREQEGYPVDVVEWLARQGDVACCDPKEDRDG